MCRPTPSIAKELRDRTERTLVYGTDLQSAAYRLFKYGTSTFQSGGLVQFLCRDILRNDTVQVS